VVFITAYNEFAIKAFKYAALDYLLKPVEMEELSRAVNEAIKINNRNGIADKLEMLLQRMKKTEASRKITLKTTEFIYVVPVDSILFCEADGAYTRFYLSDMRKVMVSKSLGEYEALIDDTDFIRTHQSYLVNMNHVIRFDKGLVPSLIMPHDHIVPVSSRKKEQVLNYLNQL
jgi:two-component system, LytTR family, response regulator